MSETRNPATSAAGRPGRGGARRRTNGDSAIGSREAPTVAGQRAAAEGRLVGAVGTMQRPRAGRRRPPGTPRGTAGPPRDRRRRASAGHIIGVFAVCFGLWLVFDANQLYQSAAAQPLGARRTVALIVLRPVAAVTNALGISGPVNAADTALGRCGSVAGSVCGTGGGIGYVNPDIAAGSDQIGSGFGLPPSPHFNSRGRGVLPPPPHLGPPALANPTAAHPLTLLSVGDSVGVDLGLGVADAFSNDSAVQVVQRGVVDSGLARSDYYNWPVQLQAALRQYRPGIVVIMMGANDAQAFYSNGRYISFGSPAWWNAYTARVATVMSDATSVGAHVLWVGLPPMNSKVLPLPYLQRVNQIYKRQAQLHPGVTYFSSWALLANKHGGFAQFLTIGGNVEQIRAADGVHLYPAGYDRLGNAIVTPMERSWHVNLKA